MILQRKVLPDRSERREERLRSSRVTKAAHAPRTSARRLVAVLPVFSLAVALMNTCFKFTRFQNLVLRQDLGLSMLFVHCTPQQVRSTA